MLPHDVKINPPPNNIIGSGLYQPLKIAQFRTGQWPSPRNVPEKDTHDPAILQQEFGLRLTALTLPVNVHGLVLVGIKINDQPEILIQLRHSYRSRSLAASVSGVVTAACTPMARFSSCAWPLATNSSLNFATKLCT